MFGKKAKVPKIKTQDYELTYDLKDSEWSLMYKNVLFSLPSHDIQLPKTKELDTYLEWVGLKKVHIENCVSEMLKGWDTPINNSAMHIAQIEIQKPDSIFVMILGDDTWGDMGYDLWITDGVIVNEGAGD